MTNRTLIVARMRPDDAVEVADVFRRSDEGELPGLVGVTHRSLFRFGDDLYFHFIEVGRDPVAAPADIGGRVDSVRSHPSYVEVNTALERYITAFSPETWRSPRDAMATQFYSWDAAD